MSDPAFQQFAERFARLAKAAKNEGDVDTGWFLTAERHARLLQAVWEWANAHVPAVTFYAPGQLEERRKFHDGIRHSQAHVRSLLQHTEER